MSLPFLSGERHFLQESKDMVGAAFIGVHFSLSS